jgi:glucan phosphoethanolaminetransferase (alkaline phosphatase superfamily)
MYEIKIYWILICGLILIFAATDINRPTDKIKMFSWPWFLRFLLVIAGGLCLFSVGKLS